MAIIYPITPPASGVARMTFRMVDVVGVGTSPYTLSDEIFEHQGKRFAVDVDVRRLERADAEEWIGGFLAPLNGRKGTFLLGDPYSLVARGALGGAPLVKGAGQLGQVLAIGGCSNNITNWLRKGDWVQLGTGSSARLHKSMSDVNTNGSGEASLDLWPGFAVAPADNAPLIFNNAVGVWRLAANERGWNVDNAIQYGINFTAFSLP
jgi:hypothetical protein